MTDRMPSAIERIRQRVARANLSPEDEREIAAALRELAAMADRDARRLAGFRRRAINEAQDAADRERVAVKLAAYRASRPDAKPCAVATREWIARMTRLPKSRVRRHLAEIAKAERTCGPERRLRSDPDRSAARNAET
jgi:hypothetical protein